MPAATAALAAKYIITTVAIMAANRIVSSIVSEGAPELNQGEENARGQLVNVRDTQAPIPLIYGKCRVGINQVYLGVSGDDNKYLHLVGVVGEGEVNGIAQKDGVDQVFLNEKLYTEYGDLVYYEFFTGTATQNVCSTLHSAIPEWTDPLRHTAYIYMRLEYDRDKFQNLPNITLEVEGLKVYNPDTEVTEYTNNPALCARDLNVRSSKRGGMGISASRLDDTSVVDTASYCSTKGWTIGTSLGKKRPVIDDLTAVLGCFRGCEIYSDNEFKLRYKDMNYESVCMSLTEDDIIETGGESSLQITQPSIFDTPNAVRIKYLNEELKYQKDDYILSDTDAIVSDGDYREKIIELYGINSMENAQKMANYFLERFRVNKSVSLIAHNRAMSLEPLDLVSLTHSIPGWTAKTFRVLNPHYLPDNLVQLELIEEESDFYDDTYNLASHDWHDTNLPDPSATPYSVINVSHSEEVYYYRKRSFTRWKIDFDSPAPEDYPWWDHAEIWIKVGTGGAWKFMTTATTDYMLDPVEEGETYYCKMVSVSIHGVKEDFDAAYTLSTTIHGKTAAPSNMSSITAVASGDTVSIYGDEISDPDVAGYELRLGDAWVGGIFMAFNETPNFRLTGVKPGTHVFWCSPKDNSGNYSATPVSSSVTVFYPSGYSDKNTWSWDYNGIGNHDNTEYESYDGNDCLKCSHADENLVGYWRLDEGSGTTAHDSSGNGNDGTLVNMEDADWVDGVVGKCLSFDGVDEAVNIGTIGDASNGDMTFNIWIYRNVMDERDIFFGNFNGANNINFELKTNNYVRIYWNNGERDLEGNVVVPNAAWVMLTIVRDTVADYFYIYHNGELKNSLSGTGTNIVSTADHFIGRDTRTTGEGFNGKIDEVRIYNKALTADEVKALYDHPGSGLGPILTGTWTSPEYDLGSEKTVRVWGDFLTTFVSSATSWEGIFPGSTTWADKTDADTRWYELTTPDAAAQLEAKIKWGLTSGNYTDEVEFFQILAPEFTARYLQVEITITDPQADANLYVKELHCKAAYWS